MNVNDIPLLALLKSKLDYVNQRQSVIAQNVANADTPGYMPKDLKPFSFEQAMKGVQGGGAVAMAQTASANPAHIPLATPAASQGGAFGVQSVEDSEVRLDGNHVVLEDQMMKMTQAKMDYDAAVGFYQQSLGLLKMALKKPGS